MAIIEAVVERRKRWAEGGHILYLSPVHVEEINSCRQPYTRANSCLIEAMIAYTRAAYWSHKRPHGCSTAAKYYQQLLDLLTGCINRTAPPGSWERRAAGKLVDRARTLLALNGCHPSSPQP